MSFTGEDQASERRSLRNRSRGPNGRNTHNDDAYDDDEQTTPMDELRDNFVTNARDFLNRMDQMTRSIRGDENSGGRACPRPPEERARRVPATDTKADVVSRREEPVEDLQKKLEKRLKHIRLLEHERDEMYGKLDEADAQLKSMRAELEARDQQLANRDDRERDRLNAATQELKAQLEKANKEIEGLKKDLDENEYRLANTQKSLSEAEKRIRETGTADVERKLREYEENRVESNRLRRENDGLRTANEDAWRQVDDLRKTNEDMVAEIAQIVNEKEHAVKQVAEIAAELRTTKLEKNGLQTRMHDLEDENQRLKEANEVFESEREAVAANIAQLQREKSSNEARIAELEHIVSRVRETAASSIAQLQQEKSSNEARIAELEHIVSRVREDEAKKQRKLEDEIVALKEHEKKVVGLLNASSDQWEAAHKMGLFGTTNRESFCVQKAEDLEAERLRLRNEGGQELEQVQDNFQRPHKTTRIRRSFTNRASFTFVDAADVERGEPVDERDTEDDSLPESRHAGVHVVHKKGTSSSASQDTLEEPMCSMCWRAPVSAKILPCEHAVVCEKCMDEAVKEKKKCPRCHGKIESWMFFTP